MSEELKEEIISITSIYGAETLVSLSEEPIVYAVTLPGQPAVSLRVEFPQDYPNAPPSILGTQSVGDNVAKGEGAYLVELARDVLSEVYTPGAPSIFDLIEEADSRLQQLGLDQNTEHEEQQAAQARGQSSSSRRNDYNSSEAQQHLEQLGQPPVWTLSEVMTEKKSVFIARSAPVSSTQEARLYLTHLLATDRKVAKATHNITAWRIKAENGVQYQDCDDDGETAAGGRVLHLMELMDVWGAMVVITRWYGGIQLGPDRFRIINQTARDALIKGGFAPGASRDGGKRKGKK